MKPLVVVTHDQAIRAELAWIESKDVFRVTEISEAAEFAASIGAVLGVGADMAIGYRGPELKTLMWVGPPVLIHAGGKLDYAGISALGIKHIWHIPDELDWLHERLGLYVAPERSHS